MSGGPRAVAEDGLQPERTRLSWSRTALSLGAVGALILHTAQSALSAGAGLVVIFLAAALYIAGVARYRGLVREVRKARPVIDLRPARAVAVAAVLAAPAALMTLFL